MIQFFAHAGEHHETVAEAAAHTATDPLIFWMLLLLAPLVVGFLAHNIFKLKLMNTLLWVGFCLIIFSIYSYQDPGAYTAVALAGGFGIVFVTALLRLAAE